MDSRSFFVEGSSLCLDASNEPFFDPSICLPFGSSLVICEMFF